jgi:hypothetical protein
MSDDNAKLDRAEALAVTIAQAVRAMRDLGADNQQIITALQIAVDEIAKSPSLGGGAMETSTFVTASAQRIWPRKADIGC